MIQENKTKILFVDDHPKDAELAWNLFLMNNPQKQDYFEASYLYEFKSSEDAVNKILAYPDKIPDIIFMDYFLDNRYYNYPPNLRGSQIVKLLRERGFLGKIVGNSSSGKIPFEKDEVSHLMDDFLPEKFKIEYYLINKT